MLLAGVLLKNDFFYKMYTTKSDENQLKGKCNKQRVLKRSRKQCNFVRKLQTKNCIAEVRESKAEECPNNT